MLSTTEIRSRVEARLQGRVAAPFQVYERPATEKLQAGIPELDRSLGGIPISAMTVVCGSRQSTTGSTTLLHALLAQITQQDGYAAVVDASDTFDSESAAAAGVALSRLLWVRCSAQGHGAMRPLEQAFKVADLLLHGGGFRLVVVDLAGVEGAALRRVPHSTWFRFHRLVERMDTALIFMLSAPLAAYAGVTLDSAHAEVQWSAAASFSSIQSSAHGVLLSGARPGFRVERQRELRKAHRAAPSTAFRFHASGSWM
jgi:recombination protein RecA